MRPLRLGDASAAARALMRVPEGRRDWVLARILREAARADAHRAACGRMHPLWGDGSVMAAARRRPLAAEPPLQNSRYRACLIRVLARIGR